MDPGDIVCHEHHGVGVVLTTGQSCEVRFLGGKGPVNAARLTVLLSADCGDQFTAEAVEASQIDSIVVRGATLWLRSDDTRLRAIALGVFSASTDPWLITTVNKCLAQSPPRARSRVTSDLSEARAQRGLDPWPEAVLGAKAELESRRLRQEAEREARRLAKAVRAQIDIIEGIRSRLGRARLSDLDRTVIEQEVRIRAAWPAPRESHCWKCHEPLHSTFNPDCPLCHWMVCVCGRCQDPYKLDEHGRRLGACPQEASLVSAQVHPESQELPF